MVTAMQLAAQLAGWSLGENREELLLTIGNRRQDFPLNLPNHRTPASRSWSQPRCCDGSDMECYLNWLKDIHDCSDFRGSSESVP